MGSIFNYLQDTGQLHEFMFPGSNARAAALVTQDYTTNYGRAIPISQGLRRISGVPIWMGPLTDGDVISTTFAGPGIGAQNGLIPQITVVTRKLTRSFAIALGYNLAPTSEIDLPKVRRIWVDGTLVYANGSTVQPIYFNPSNNTYQASYNKVQTYNGILYGNGDGAPVPLNPIPNAFPGIFKTDINFNFHAGTEDQIPDPLIVADRGDLASAYRGMIYMVIKDLAVGTATDMTKYSTFNDGSGSWGADREVKLANALPKIDVELVDGTTVSSTPQDFDLLPEATPFPYANEICMSNWDKRQIAVVSPASNIQTYDVDAKAQISVVPFIKLDPDDTFGDSHNFTDWDTYNDVLYGHLRNTGAGTAYPIAAVNKATGQIYPSPYDNFHNLGFKDASNNDALVSGNPVVKIPELLVGGIGYYLNAGQLGTVICGTGLYSTGCVLMPSNNGQVWPPSFPPTALHDFGDPFLTAQALPLVSIALENGAPSFQDAAFVVAYGPRVALVYVTIDHYIYAEGGSPQAYNYGKITGVEVIYTAPDLGMQCSALVTSDHNILILVYENLTSTNHRIAKINLSYSNSPDFAVAPGWKGYFPASNGIAYDVEVPYSGAIVSLQPPGSDTLKFSNTVNGQLLYRDNVLISVDDGSVTVVNPSGNLGTGYDTWDDVTKTNFGHGSTPNGDNMRYVQMGTAISGNVGLLKNYLKWYGLRAGFTAANINVDTKIDDQVVGSILVSPKDMAQLFNDLGTLYGFIWFVSGGVLKFVKNNQAPIKASATLTISSQPADGNTVTIGAFVYTFKLIPAAPFDVKIDGSAKETTLINLMKAINKSGEDGFEYFSVTSANTDVLATCPTDTTLKVTAKSGGAAGNTIAIAKTGTAVAWAGGGSTLTGGDAAPAASINLTLDNMMAVQNGPVGEGAALVTTFPAPQKSSQAAQIAYYNLDADYVPATQTFTPDDGSDASGLYNVALYDTTFVMASAEAYNRITKVAVTVPGTDVIQEFQLPQQFMRIEPSDVASITIGSYNYTVRLDEVTFNGDYTISVTGQNYSFRDDIPVTSYIPQSRQEQTIKGPGDGTALVVDGPLLDPLVGGAAGLFVIYSGIKTYGQAGWRSAQMQYRDDTKTANPLYTAAVDVPYGTAASILPDTSTPFLTDTTTVLRVISKTIEAADLANATDDQFYNNGNLLIVGKPGRWEYIAFKNVSAVNSKVFEFTSLARGRRGTDVNVGTHEANDEVYLVKSVAAGFNAPLMVQAQAKALVGQVGAYTVVGLPANRAPVEVDVTFSGESLKPFSPCNLTATLAAGNDIDLAWNRRDRLSTSFITDTPPLSETSEKYDLEILSAGVVVRTLTDLTSPSYTYVSADQTTDGFTPPLASLEIRVYQKGELGRGYPKQETLDVK